MVKTNNYTQIYSFFVPLTLEFELKLKLLVKAPEDALTRIFIIRDSDTWRDTHRHQFLHK
jgi:hypothetical protein